MSDVLKRLAEVGKARVEAVEIGGETFHVRGMTSHQRAVFLLLLQQATIENSTVPDDTVVALGLCNEDGSALGPLEEVKDQIANLDGAVLYKLAARTLALSGFGHKAIEKAEKN